MFEPRTETITEVKWNGEDEVEIHCGSTIWAGAKRKDFWGSDEDWESKIKEGVRIRYWTIQWSIILGFEIEIDNKWVSVWCKANNFQTKAEREKSSNAYANFIIKEGKKIAIAIDEGKTLEEIDKLIDKGHSGNTYGMALNYGIGHAKDKGKAEIVRREHNLKYGVKDSGGVVNPAIITIG